MAAVVSRPFLKKSLPLLSIVVGILAAHSARADAGDWELGPFTRPENPTPIIKPDPAATFDCPMRGQPVHWEATHTFNPAAIVKDGKVYILYRAEDDSGHSLGGYTSRLGLAVSDDGIHFRQMPHPVLYPDNDSQKANEWTGGCEDPRCVETEDGTYVLFYTEYAHRPPKLGMATSRDLVHWTKCGPVNGLDSSGSLVQPSKSASLVCAVRDGRIVASRIGGKYWLYYGEGAIRLLTSPDLHTWTPAPKFNLPPRAGHFDSGLAECGPPALLTGKGIVLLYNGKNAGPPRGDPKLPTGVYSDGQALFDANDPSRLIARAENPFFKPEQPWEATGQYTAGTTFIEGLVLFHQKWFLYYGCADTYVGVATAPLKPGEAPGSR
ncbi:MAG TPA: glycoside hydrolase family 130 protein [Chthoniobacteraceae bacterium]|nr:glycoside hydrolase family 130 protein [Chthoniobacteraceae bacterium]